MRFETPQVLPNFNAALNQCKGERSEVEFARTMNCTARTLYNWRRNNIPEFIKSLAHCPGALAALAADLNGLSNDTTNPPK